MKLNGTPLKCKSAAKDRKGTLRATPIHPDSIAGFEAIIKYGQVKYEELITKVEKLDFDMQEETENIQQLRDISDDIEADDNYDEEEIDLVEQGNILNNIFKFDHSIYFILFLPGF